MSELMWNVGFTQRLLFYKVRPRHIEAGASLRSVSDRMHHARYHFHQVNAPWSELLQKAENLRDRMRLLGWGASEEELDEQREEAIRRTANIVACVQALHAVPDTMAFALYHCLELTLPDDKYESDINVSLICKWLKDRSDLRAFQEILQELTTGDTYMHLSALSNHAKHRSIIGGKVFADATGTDPLPLRLTFAEFRYKNAYYAQRDALQLLQIEFDRINPIVIKCGMLIDAYLADKPNSL